MISKTYIEKNLKSLDSRYRRAKNPKETLYFSKLAILELCGWIEVSMDDLLLTSCRRRLKESKNIAILEHDIVKRNYGFKYDKNFRGMMIRAIGIIRVEKLEFVVDQLKRARLESELGNLSTTRDKLAHTYIKGTTINIDSPSVTISRYKNVYDGLKEYQNKIKLVI